MAGTGDVTPKDVTISGSDTAPIGGNGAVPPTGGKGPLKNLSKNQKYAVYGVGAVIVGLGVYLLAKHKNSSSSGTTTTSAIPDASGTVAETPLTDGEGNVGSSTGGNINPGGPRQGGNGNLSNQLTQLFAQNDQAIAAEIASLNVMSGTSGGPSGGTGIVAQAASSGTSNSAGGAATSNPPTTYGAGADVGQPAPSGTPSWASTVFSNNGETYYGVPKTADISLAEQQGYTITNAKAAGVPGGTTGAKYAYKAA